MTFERLVINDQREQEWNISRNELLELVEVGILTEDDIDQAIATSFNPVYFMAHVFDGFFC